MTPDAMLMTTWLGLCSTAWAIVTDGATRLATANTARRARVSPVPLRSAGAESSRIDGCRAAPASRTQNAPQATVSGPATPWPPCSADHRNTRWLVTRPAIAPVSSSVDRPWRRAPSMSSEPVATSTTSITPTTGAQARARPLALAAVAYGPMRYSQVTAAKASVMIDASIAAARATPPCRRTSPANAPTSTTSPRTYSGISAAMPVHPVIPQEASARAMSTQGQRGDGWCRRTPTHTAIAAAVVSAGAMRPIT